MQTTSELFMLRMVSMTMMVLPVWRSPMMSSRWPRPMGIMVSMALIPVWSGSRAGWGAGAPAEEDGPDVLLLEVQGQAEDAPRELEELIGHDPVEPIDAGDAVADRSDGPDLADVDAGIGAFDLLLDDPGDLIGFDAHDNLYLCGPPPTARPR